MANNEIAISEVIENEVVAGQVIQITFAGHKFPVVVIEPNGIGEGQPTIGLTLRMADPFMGIDQSTLSRWLTPLNGENQLKVPSGKTFKVFALKLLSGQDALVIEASDWFALAKDLLLHPGKLRQSTKVKLLDFMEWFAVKGIYASAYTALKGVYSAQDDAGLSDHLTAQKQLLETLEEARLMMMMAVNRVSNRGSWNNDREFSKAVEMYNTAVKLSQIYYHSKEEKTNGEEWALLLEALSDNLGNRKSEAIDRMEEDQEEAENEKIAYVETVVSYLMGVTLGNDVEEFIEDELSDLTPEQWTPNLIWSIVDPECPINKLPKAKKQAVLESTELYQA